MKRIITFSIALLIGVVAFGQTKTANNPLVSDQNYKHPFAAKAAKDNNIGVTEKFTTETVADASDYKHPQGKRMARRVHVRQGTGANPAASTKHPFGL